MIGYFDSSALVKLLIEEEGSNEAAASWDGADVVLCSRVGRLTTDVTRLESAGGSQRDGEHCRVIIPAMQLVGALLAIALWLFTARRVAQDPRLHPQARQGMSYAVLLMPLLAVVYWGTGMNDRTPFWLQPLVSRSAPAPARSEPQQ